MAVNIASRLQNIAGEGEIIISENTFQNISEQKIAGQIDATPLTPAKVKGIDKPITLYRINF